MKITKQRLREIIKEELSTTPDEPVTEIFGGAGAPPWDGDFAREQHKAVLDMIQILKVRLARVEKELGKTWDPAAAEAHAVDLGE